MDEPRKTTLGEPAKARRARQKPSVGAAPPEAAAGPVSTVEPQGAEVTGAPAGLALPLIGRIRLEEAASLVPSAALVGLGLALESELLVGIAIGTGVAVVSKLAPEPVSGALLPVVNSTLKACYNAAVTVSEMLGEAIKDIEGAITGIAGPPSEQPKPEQAPSTATSAGAPSQGG